MQEGVFHQQKSWVSGMVMLPEQEQQLRCPRCNSTNTKFCYYNNYNLYQPRHFCRSCRRYWTKGGALRNVPVGGGTRKTNKRSRGHASSSPPTSQNKSPNLEMTTGENLSMPMDLSSMYPCPLATSTTSLE